MTQPSSSVVAPSAEDIDRDVRILKEALRVVLGAHGGAPSANAKEQSRATEWLRSFRRRDNAWDSCVAVLGASRGPAPNQVSLEEQVFASQALLYKCRRRSQAITGEDVSCLFRLALGFTGAGLRPVLTQLCLGICACAVRHYGWEAAKVLPDMVQYCQKASGDAGFDDPGPRILMLELLTVLPDEATARSGITARPERRAEFLWTLKANGRGGKIALEVLSQLMEPGALPTLGAPSAILRCALGWVQLEAVERADMLSSRVMVMALDALESPEACDEACELVTVSLEAFTDPGAVEEILPRILAKRQALATASSEDVCRCLASVFAAASCAYVPCILRPDISAQWESLLQVMVGMLEHPSLEIAELALEFWGLLGELLTETSAGGRGPRSPALEESVRRACVMAMLRARYPAEGAGGLAGMDGDARDELEDFREQVQELFQTLILPAATSVGARGGAAGSPPPSKKHPHDRVGQQRGPGEPRRRASPSPHGAPFGSRATSPSRDKDAGIGRRVHSGNSDVPVVTPESARRGFHRGNGVHGVRGPAKEGTLSSLSAAAAAAAEAGMGDRRDGQVRVVLVLSPVQEELLAWLEGLAVAGVRRALQVDQQQRQQLHERRRLSASSWNVRLDGVVPRDNKLNGDNGALSDGGMAERMPGRGGETSAILDNSVGGVEEGTAADWPQVEVLLRMLSAVAKGLSFRDYPNGHAVSVGGISANGHRSVHGHSNDHTGHGEQSIPEIPPVTEGFVGGIASTVVAGAEGTGDATMETLVAMLPALPGRIRELQRSVAVLIGELATWLARRPGSGLEPAIQAVLGILRLEEVEVVAEGSGGAGGSRAAVNMSDKGEDHVGAVALAKLVSAAGPSLASIPRFPTHLLERYLELSLQLQRHRLRSQTGGDGGHGVGNGNGHVAEQTYPLQLEQQQQQQQSQNSGPVQRQLMEYPAEPPPPLHAGSLRLFLGCLCRMLGEAPPATVSTAAAISGSNDRHQQQLLRADERGGNSEVEEVLRALVEGEVRCLRGVLDRRRHLAAPGVPNDDESRALADVARDSLSNLSLILRKTGSALNAPGLLSHCCGIGDGQEGDAAGEGGEFFVGMLVAFGSGEAKVLPSVCRVFESLVWSTAERLRHVQSAIVGRFAVPPNDNRSINGHHHQLNHVAGAPPGLSGIGGDAASAAVAAVAGGIRMSAIFGDALAEAFVRRPFVRFLDALRGITKELPTFGRCASPSMEGVPDVSMRACDWVNRCLYSAATENVGGGGSGGGWGAGTGGGPDAHPELVEALFKVMTEWVNELPQPSLRWLEAWLSVAVSGLAVRHRGPARAVLTMIQACCLQKKEPAFSAAFVTLLRDTGLGVAMTRGLLSGMCGAMPSWMLDDLVATMRSLFDSLLPAAVTSWVEAVLRDPTFERYSLSDEYKASFSRKLKEDFCCKDWRAFKAGLKAFCGGKKKGTGGTPPVHASAAQRQPPVQDSSRPTSLPYVSHAQQQQLLLQQQQAQHAHQAQQAQQAQRFDGHGGGVGGGPFGSSGGVVGDPGGSGDGGGHAASQHLLRSMTM